MATLQSDGTRETVYMDEDGLFIIFYESCFGFEL